MCPSSDHSGRNHAKLSPSGFAKWGTCPLSLELEEQMPPEGDKPYSDWGTARHEESEQVLLEKAELPEDPDARYVVETYTDYCLSLETANSSMVECKVTLASYGLPQIYGTADFIGVVGDTLHVVDLKAGISPVYPDCGQLKIYALAAATADRLLYFNRVVMTIVQPRVSTTPLHHTMTPFDLVHWLEHTLRPAVRAAEGPAPYAVASEAACQWCRAKPVCKAYDERVTSLAQQSFRDFTPRDIATLTPEELSQILPHIGEIEKYLKALKAHCKSYMEQGSSIPGHKLVQGRKSRAWRSEDEARRFCLRKVKKDDAYTYKFKSPAQIEKFLIKTKHNAALQELIEVKPGAPTIVKDDDKRTAITSTAALAFAGMEDKNDE